MHYIFARIKSLKNIIIICLLKKRIKFPLVPEKIYYKNISKLSHFYFFPFFFQYLNNRYDISKSIFSQWSILRYFVYTCIYSTDEFKSMIATRRWGKVSGSYMCSLNRRRKKKKKKGSHYKKFSRKEKSIIYNNENNSACK